MKTPAYTIGDSVWVMFLNQAKEIRIAGVRNVAIQINAEDNDGKGAQEAEALGVALGVATYSPESFEYLLDTHVSHGTWVGEDTVFPSKDELLASI